MFYCFTETELPASDLMAATLTTANSIQLNEVAKFGGTGMSTLPVNVRLFDVNGMLLLLMS